MPFLPRLSWGKKRASGSSNRSSTSSKSSPSNSTRLSAFSTRSSGSSVVSKSCSKKKVVRFDVWPEIGEADYIITESVHKALWYRKEDLHLIKQENQAHINRVAMGDLSQCRNAKLNQDDDDCHRGLECHIRDRVQKYPSRTQHHFDMTQGLLMLQARQRRHGSGGVVDPEQLRRYCVEKTRKHQARAELLAARDAMIAMRVYKASDHWKSPMEHNDYRKTNSSGSEAANRDVLPFPKPSIKKSVEFGMDLSPILCPTSSPRQTKSSRAA